MQTNSNFFIKTLSACALLCKNAFDAKMYLMRTFCFAEHFPLENVQQTKMLESGKMHLMLPLHFVGAEHFPLENVMLNILQRKMYAKMHLMLCKNAFDAKMHLMPKCILAYIFQRKMFSCAKMLCFLLCKKQRCCAKMHLMQKCIFATHHILFCKNAFLHQQNVTNAFDAKMHLMRCKNAFLHQMHFGNATRTFDFVKCSASHLTL